MDHFRGQEKELRPCSLGFSQFAQGRKRSRDGNDNKGNSTVLFTHSQTLDHHHHQLQRQSTAQGRVPDPDRIITDPENPGAGFARSNSKTPSPPSIIYLECLKNHAASVGGHLLDGCGEFMPSGEERSLEALKCAACECHRNFHRKEISGETNFRRSMLHSLQLTPSPLPLLQDQKFSTTIIVPPMQVAPYNTNTESSSEDLNAFHSGDVATAPPFLVSKKLFRTKFTQEQKEKFRNFVLRLGLKDKFLKLFSLVLVLSLLWFSHWCWFCQSGRSSRTVQRWKMGWTQ